MLQSSLLLLLHCEHVVKSFEARVEAGVACLGIVAEIQHGHVHVAANVLQHGHAVDLGRAAGGFHMDDAVEALLRVL